MSESPSEPKVEMTTYSRTDGEPIGEYSFVMDIDTCEATAETAPEPVEFQKERWVRVAVHTFTLPYCSATDCYASATHWGLCELHAREDDPTAFDLIGDPS